METEIKLLATPAMLETLQRHSLLAGEQRSLSLETTYFDTPDGRLSAAGASLRLRRGDGEPEQTFKQSNNARGQRGPMVRRRECNAPAHGDHPDTTAFPAEAANALARILDGQEPAPLAMVRVRRATLPIRHGAALIEAAFDRGEITAAGRNEPICELELELREGSLADAFQLALALPLGPDLRWSVAAKGSRAFSLAHGEPATPVRAAPVCLDPAMTIAQAFRTVCWSCLDHLLANCDGLIARQSNEALHQCRVAIRRLRAALSLFAGRVDSEAATRFRKAFGSAASALGEARELHVLIEALARSAAHADTALVAEFTGRRDAALASAAALLGGEDFQRLLFAFASWIETVEADEAASVTDFAAGVLTKDRKRLKHAGRHVQAMTDHELHRLRIKVKKMRYAMEFFVGLAGNRAADADKYADVLGKLQDRLGTLHDLSERIASGPLFADYHPTQAAQLLETLERQLGPSGKARDDLVESAAKALAKLLALPRWWQADPTETGAPEKRRDEAQLKALQIRLSAMQREIITEGRKLLIILEGRDAAGKDGTIKRIAEHMSPRDTRVVAMGVPNAHDRKAWYFQRWCCALPVAGEIALFNRSWYNRAGVEHVMGFCSDAEYEEFIASVVPFEQLLARAGFTILKYYLDISKDEQRRRLHDRETDPLKQWKISPIDKLAGRKWKRYSQARNAMLARTHSSFAPWIVVKADDKPKAHLALIRDLLSRCGQAVDDAELSDPGLVFVYDDPSSKKGWLSE